MRPASVVFPGQAVLPGYLAALQQQLGEGGSQAPADVLGPISALKELEAAAIGVIEGHGGIYRPNRRSLCDDVFLALKRLGPAVSAEVESLIRAIQRDLADETVLMEPDGARVMAAAASALREQLSSCNVIVAAWDDTLAAFKSGRSAEQCEERLQTLREVAEGAGHDWSTLSSRIQHALNDSRIALAELRGEELTEAQWEGLQQPAGVSLEERLELCRGHLGRSARKAHIVAWVGFDHAFLPRQYLRLGPVEFFSSQDWPEAVIHGWYSEGAAPVEMGNSERDFFFRDLPTDHDFVLARVDLGHRHVAGMREAARQLALATVQLAIGGSRWRLMRGTAVVTDGHWSGSPLRPPDSPSSLLHDVRYEGTGERLYNVDPRAVEAVARGDQSAEDTMSYVRWHEAVTQVEDPAHRVALAMRLLERALPDVSSDEAHDRWRAAAARYLRWSWAEDEILEYLHEAASAGLSGIAQGLEPPEDDRSLFAQMLPSAGMGYRVNTPVILARAGELAERLPEGSVSRRLLTEIAARTIDGPCARKWLGVHEQRFDRLLARAVRQRNAVLHGNDVVPQVVETVNEFVLRLAGMVVGTKVQVLAGNERFLDVLERARHDALTRRQALDRGGDPGALLLR